MHIVAARLGCERPMVGTMWASSRRGCMDRLRKHYSHLVVGPFLVRMAAWSVCRCMATTQLVKTWFQFCSQSLDRSEDMVH